MRSRGKNERGTARPSAILPHLTTGGGVAIHALVLNRPRSIQTQEEQERPGAHTAWPAAHLTPPAGAAGTAQWHKGVAGGAAAPEPPPPRAAGAGRGRGAVSVVGWGPGGSCVCVCVCACMYVCMPEEGKGSKFG